MLKDTGRPCGVIRAAVPADLPAIARLCAAHAAFERAGPVPADLAARLGPVLFSASPRAWCLVVEREGELIGYATFSLEFSTWQATDYVHLDCLVVTEPHRGEGWGRALLSAVKDAAAIRGVAHIQWQTPDWNTDAIRFYHRAGPEPGPRSGSRSLPARQMPDPPWRSGRPRARRRSADTGPPRRRPGSCRECQRRHRAAGT
ncbi:GNAT family N-acetyltransferase [Streptomyces sp. DH41]|uniref:GNAT family N-acetyltransferase n=1 Tax=Streptomyces sp. DH41 TaxID=3040125 RepID=UPI002442A2D2|nr:GNAT family N-acetyltransferase [Streptomyces sp. DH41]MDG9728409.1 GNAT family N-acetyltransferase [Streptomyces sp. DH41]